MLRYSSFLAVFLTLLVYLEAPSKAAEPVRFTPLTVGTVLDYGTWKCEITRSEGFVHRCSDGKNTLDYVGKFFAVGVVPNQIYGNSLQNFQCENSDYGLITDIEIQEASIADALWPLKVGSTTTIYADIKGSYPQQARIEVEVGNPEVRSIAGRELTVYPVNYVMTFDKCPASVQSWLPKGIRVSLRTEMLYAPEIGAIVESRMWWSEGPSRGLSRSYRLKAIDVAQPRPQISRLSRSIDEDRVAPKIKMEDAIKTTEASVLVNGQVIDDSQVVDLTVNGRPVQFGVDGRFSIRRGVPLGVSQLRVSAVDEWGNRSHREISVTRRFAGSADKDVTELGTQEKIPDLHFGKYHALVIGNNKYHSLPVLETARNDAQQLATLLNFDYGFEANLLTNATRGDILRALSKFRRTLTPDDNLLIYYAGHGIVDDVVQEGYWLPVNATLEDPSNWISNTDITNMLRAIRAKHIMVIADSCYSGTLTRAVAPAKRFVGDRMAWIERIVTKRARTAITSGGMEPVADGGGDGHSVFTRALLSALRSNRTVIEGQRLFDKLKRPVVLNANQTPEYADIRRAGHDGGDFIFVRNRK